MRGMMGLAGSWLLLFCLLVRRPVVVAAAPMAKCNLEVGAGRSSPPPATTATVYGSVDFEFWYAVGLTKSTILDDIGLVELEQLLYTSIDEGVLWCSNGDLEVDQDQATEQPMADGAGSTRRRFLQANGTSTTPDNGGGIVGPVLFTPGRPDEITDRNCPSTLPGKADQCVVVKGHMRILAYDINRVELAIRGIRDGVRSSIESRVWERHDVKGVAFLFYLGDTEEEAFQGGTAGGGFTLISSAVGDDDDGGIARLWMIGPPLLIVLLLLSAAFFTFNKYHQRPPPVRKPNNVERSLVGTGDHPKSCHRGSYHYTPNGQQYLSTVCAQCLATRREYFYYLSCAEQAGQTGHLGDSTYQVHRLVLDSPKDDLMGTIMENEPYNCIPVRPNMQNGLAARHWGNDVHNCGSALCQRCATRTGSPIFIKTGVRKSIDPEASEQSDSIWIDPRLRISPEHAEV